MPFDAADLASRLLHRELTPDRLLKLRRHLARDPWVSPSVMDAGKVSQFLEAIEAHELGGTNARAFVHDALVNQPARTIEAPPADIAEKVEAFKVARAAKQAAPR